MLPNFFYLIICITGGTCFFFLLSALLIKSGFAIERRTPRLYKFFLGCDWYAMAHNVDESEAQTRVSTALGGACTYLAITLMITIAGYLTLAYIFDNNRTQVSLLPLDDIAWQNNSGYGWATFPKSINFPQALPETASILLRATVSGGDGNGACASPLSVTSDGLAQGSWALFSTVNNCGAGAVQFTFVCNDCRLGSGGASLSLLFSDSCQAVQLEAAAQPPKLQASTASAFAVPGRNANLESIVWDVGPLLFKASSYVADFPPDSRGYALTSKSGASLSLHPASSSSMPPPVNVTFIIRASPVFLKTTEEHTTAIAQFAASILGLGGIIVFVGRVFTVFESLCNRDKKKGAGGLTAAALQAVEGRVEARLAAQMRVEELKRAALEQQLREEEAERQKQAAHVAEGVAARLAAQLSALEARLAAQAAELARVSAGVVGGAPLPQEPAASPSPSPPTPPPAPPAVTGSLLPRSYAAAMEEGSPFAVLAGQPCIRPGWVRLQGQEWESRADGASWVGETPELPPRGMLDWARVAAEERERAAELAGRVGYAPRGAAALKYLTETDAPNPLHIVRDAGGAGSSGGSHVSPLFAGAVGSPLMMRSPLKQQPFEAGFQ